MKYKKAVSVSSMYYHVLTERINQIFNICLQRNLSCRLVSVTSTAINTTRSNFAVIEISSDTPIEEFQETHFCLDMD